MQRDKAQSILISTHTHVLYEDTHIAVVIYYMNVIAILSLTTLCLAQRIFLSLPSLYKSFTISVTVNLLGSVRVLLVFTGQIPASVIKADDLGWVGWTHSQ